MTGLAASALAYAGDTRTAFFDWFEYRGKDAWFEAALPPHGYRNPILAGFYPDPSVARAGSHYYLVNSTFAYLPGIPVFESSDLVHWRQIGNVLDAASGVDFTGMGVSRAVFAPAIRFHGGMFYVICTVVDGGGTFISTARSAAGPWTKPKWLPQVDGIDPSLFFDDDGSVYVLNNGEPDGIAQYPGHRAIWLQRFDPTRLVPVGPRRVILNGGADFTRKPIWIEGPHLYQRGGFYYLVCAEGGTSVQHSEVVLRARSPWGPFEPYRENPILTQRDLGPRPFAVIAAGHADLTTAADGSWWAVFLGVRPYGDGHYNTGRETYLLPVSWRSGWPVILPQGEAVPRVVEHKGFSSTSAAPQYTGNLTWRDDFDTPKVRGEWLQLRSADRSWLALDTRRDWLAITPRTDSLRCRGTPTFLGRRQQHTTFEASLRVELPERPDVAAGMGIFQNESAWYFFAIQRDAAHPGHATAFVQRADDNGERRIASLPLLADTPLVLDVESDSAHYSFHVANGTARRVVLEGDDGTFLSTDVAGGFVGTVLGPYARIQSEDPLCALGK